MKALVGLMLAVATTALFAQEINPERAHFNYQLFCQGCHAPDGMGANAVPRLKGHIGIFLRSQPGREYLVRVPGSATSALDDAKLAEVLNWIILEFAGDSVSEPFELYSAQEVATLRQNPLNEVDRYREQLLAEIAATNSRD